MGSFDPLKENQPVEIELPGDEHRYRSRVEGLLGEKLMVASPLKSGAVIPLAPGSDLKVIYTDNVAVYTYVTRVISQNKRGVSITTLETPSEIHRIQRRNFVRLDTKLKVLLKKLDDKFIPAGEAIPATTIDISGGGLMFTCNTVLQMGEILEAELILSQQENVRSLGRVVRFADNPSGARDKYSVGFEYTLIEESERDKIIRFIFMQQRELRRKGLL